MERDWKSFERGASLHLEFCDHSESVVLVLKVLSQILLIPQVITLEEKGKPIVRQEKRASLVLSLSCSAWFIYFEWSSLSGWRRYKEEIDHFS